MAIIDIYNAVTTELALHVTGLKSHLGEQWLKAEESPPRVIWCPVGVDQYSSPIGQGGDQVGQPLGNPRPLWTNSQNFEIHLWAANVDATGKEVSDGANLAACELLKQEFIRALHKVAWGSYAITTGKWASPVMGAQVRFGVLYTLSLNIRVPMTRATDPTVTLISFNPTTYKLTFPDGTTEIVVVTT